MQFIKELWYSPFFRYPLRRIAYKFWRFLWDVIPDILVIAAAVFILIHIWEWCFWR